MIHTRPSFSRERLPPVAGPQGAFPEALDRIDTALESALDLAGGSGAPPGLLTAMRYAVFPGGARIRPKLCLAVARACGDDAPRVSDAAAAAVELLHCASLVHDDLPCFDDAATRRGRPSLHRAFGERQAVLAGDALIVLAFQSVVAGAASVPLRLGAILPPIARGVGSPGGIVAGQAWESEANVYLSEYQRAKTGALFAAATAAGAGASGADGAAWQAFGERIGEAYQVADDLRDALATADELGKPVHRDEALGRPNAVAQLGAGGAYARMAALLEAAIAAIPECGGEAWLRDYVVAEAAQFLPARLARNAA
jgi:geranylgeranyl diphosphate synthase type II